MSSINWQPIIESALSALIVVGVPLLVAALSGIFSEWKKNLAVKAEDSWYSSAGKMVAMAVLSTGQVLADDLKAASSDGKLSEDERAKCLAHAMNVARSLIGEIPAQVKPKFESWLRAEVESAVARLKIWKTVPPVLVPTSGVQTAMGSKIG